jgi:hypothetical protein
MAKLETADTGLSARVTGRRLNIPPERAWDVQSWLRKVAAASQEKSLFDAEDKTEGFAVPETRSTDSFEVVGIPLNKPGLYVAEIESAILGKVLLNPPKPMFVPAAALVSIAVALRYKDLWDRSMARISVYMDVDGLNKYFPVSQTGDPVLAAHGVR